MPEVQLGLAIRNVGGEELALREAIDTNIRVLETTGPRGGSPGNYVVLDDPNHYPEEYLVTVYWGQEDGVRRAFQGGDDRNCLGLYSKLMEHAELGSIVLERRVDGKRWKSITTAYDPTAIGSQLFVTLMAIERYYESPRRTVPEEDKEAAPDRNWLASVEVLNYRVSRLLDGRELLQEQLALAYGDLYVAERRIGALEALNRALEEESGTRSKVNPAIMVAIITGLAAMLASVLPAIADKVLADDVDKAVRAAEVAKVDCGDIQIVPPPIVNRPPDNEHDPSAQTGTDEMIERSYPRETD